MHHSINLGYSKGGRHFYNMYFWSNQNANDALFRLRKSVIAHLWEVPSNETTEYLGMQDSESRTHDNGRWI